MHEYLNKRPERHAQLFEQVQLGRLEVWELDALQVDRIFQMVDRKPGLSPYDCSVYILAEDNKGTLLADDRALRRYAKEQGVQVHGLIYCIDLLVGRDACSHADALRYLRKWLEVDPRAPRPLIEERIKAWS